jgi:hypothetical protein
LNRSKSIDAKDPELEADTECVRAGRLAIAICAFFLAAFAVLAWSAVSGKSPTVDEPVHALAGWLQLWQRDDRLVCDHPPLWSTVAALATGPHSIRADMNQFNRIDFPIDVGGEDAWVARTLFQTRGNNATLFLARFRAMMLAAAVLMGVLLALFVWRAARAGGAKPSAAAAAAVFSTGLLALDPNFLAHSPLVKDDVVSALALLALTASTWAAGRALTGRRVLLLGICSGAAITVKLNAPLMIGSSAVLLLLRALSPWRWKIGLGPWADFCVSRARRVAAAAMALVIMSAMTIGIIWLSYGLRFAPSPEVGGLVDIQGVMRACVGQQWQSMHQHETIPRRATLADLAATPRPLLVRLADWANEWHVLPQAFITGMLFTFQITQSRPSFLLGQFGITGTWWYFPFVMGVKTPVATLATFVAAPFAAGVVAWRRRKTSLAADPAALPTARWTALCLSVPAVIYIGAAMAAHVNLGIRHILPVYPLLFAAVGLAAARLWDWRRVAALAGGLILLSVLAAESCWAYPNYIPFFNLLAGGSSGGIRLLSDSNLDWGQDLPLLASWQRSNPHTKLYLAYFGSADPAYYGISYTNLQSDDSDTSPAQRITEPGVIAISVTILQGTYSPKLGGRPPWSILWSLKPFDVLGGSIYLFHVPATQADRLPPGQSLID